MINHLWQSTLFTVAVALLAIAFRRNRAQVRYWLWFIASVKFFIPFSLLMSLGSHLLPPKSVEVRPLAAMPLVAVAMVEIAQPFSETSPQVSEVSPLAPAKRSSREWKLPALLFIWGCGVAGIALIRFRGWRRVRAAVRASAPLSLPAPVEIRSSPGLLEPGVVGFVRPVLLLPAGIEERLTATQLEAVLAHELCHVRRRDNVTSAIHMIVEAVLWFHPLVWWIGSRLVEERELACDEEVLRLGNQPREYAEGILNVCKLYVESPLACVSGVTGGSGIKKRIEAIMKNSSVLSLSFGKKLVLASTGIVALAGPVLVGVMNSPIIRAQSVPAAAITPSLFAQAQAVPPPAVPSPAILPPGGRGGFISPQTVGALIAKDEAARRLEEAVDKFGSGSRSLQRILVQYGRPDSVENGGFNGQNPSSIWRYNYIEDFHSSVEFEFVPGKPMHINWPMPVIYEGKSGVAPELTRRFSEELRVQPEPTAALPGLPDGHATMQIYPSQFYRVLSVPLDSLLTQTGLVDVIAQISTDPSQSPGLNSTVAAVVRDSIRLAKPAESPATGPADYTAQFGLNTGSYICSVVVRDQSSGRMYGETINFEVK